MKTVGIFLAGQAGDILESSCALHYRQELWGDCKIVWYIEDRNRDLLKYQDIELREFPRGFGYPIMVEEENYKLVAQGKEPIWHDWQPLVDWDNRMNVALKPNYPELEDIDIGYFPAPHQHTSTQRHNIPYALISKKVFGVQDEFEWHPVLNFSNEEIAMAVDFMDDMPHRKTICAETFAGSGQSILSHEQVIRTMEICQDVFGQCNFIFLSHKYLRSQEEFPEEITKRDDVFFASNFTVRRCALIVGMSHLLISVSSGITVASSSWENKGKLFKTLQYCGSEICSTKGIAHEGFELITHDDKSVRLVLEEYYERLISLLKEIK